MFACIEPFYNKAEKINPFLQPELFWEMQKRQQTSSQNAQIWIQGFFKIRELELRQDEKCVLSMVSYLVLAESVYRFIVDQLSCVLVKAGASHPFNPKNVTNCKGISEESLGTKRRFLHENGLERIANAFDNRIRNAAGHLLFELQEDGIHIDGIDGTVDPNAEWMKLRNATMAGLVAIAHYYDIYHGPMKHFSDSVFTSQAGVAMVEMTMPDMICAVPALWPDIARDAENRFKHTVN